MVFVNHERKELPVSEAPRDGRRVLLRARHMYMSAEWRNGDWMEPGTNTQIEYEPEFYLPPEN